MPVKQPFSSSSRPSSSKASISLPLKSAMKPHARVAQPLASSKAAGKRKASVAEAEEDEESDASQDSNATGFSDLEDDELMDDEMDVDALEEGEKAGDEDEDVEDDDEMDTEDEIDAAKDGKKKSKKNTKKRKLPTSADTFGATLTSLLADQTAADLPPTKRSRPATAQPILSLSSKPLPPSSAKLALEAKAKRVLKVEKQEREDRARVKDVIEGWASKGDGTPGGQEWERGLRKVAQRGVVKLFNAILVASQTNPTNPAALVNNERKSKKEKDNILGRGGREDRLTKEGFLDMIKSGGK